MSALSQRANCVRRRPLSAHAALYVIAASLEVSYLVPQRDPLWKYRTSKIEEGLGVVLQANPAVTSPPGWGWVPPPQVVPRRVRFEVPF